MQTVSYTHLDVYKRQLLMCKKYNVLDARKRVFFIVMELLEKAGRKAPCRSRTVRKESREGKMCIRDRVSDGKGGGLHRLR